MASLAYVLGRCLLARWGPETAVRDFGLADELLALGGELGDGELELFALNWRNTMLGELGEFAALERELDRMERMAVALRQPRAMVFLPLHRGLLALVAGRFDETERLNAESVEIGRRIAGSVSQLAAGAQMVMLRLQQGRLDEVEAQVRGIAAAHPGLVPLRCALITLLLQTGRSDEARNEFERVVGPGLERLPRDNTYILTLSLLADVAAELGDEARARALYEWLAPYAGRWVVVASDTALWPVDRSLGRLAGASGRAEVGLAHLEAARRAAGPVDAAPSLALVALDEARLRAGRAAPGDLEAAARRAAEALALGARQGMRHVVSEAGRLAARRADGAPDG
jgi:tetratricopeptide (TPR) repeat protein